MRGEAAGLPFKERVLRRGGLWTLILSMPILASAAWQQAPTELERLELALWPEFDRPSVLVIYRFQLPAAAVLPATIALPVPSEVTELHALAFVGSTGGLFNIQDYTIQPGERWGTAVFETPARQGQLEFYAALEISGEQRSFQFDWPGGVALDSLGYEVQQPPTATEFSVLPEPGRQQAAPNGLTHHYGSLATSGSASIVVNYRKADALLSADSLAASPPPAALGQPTSPPVDGPDLQSALPWALGGLGALLLGAGAIWYLRLSRSTPARAAPRRTPRRRRPSGVETEASPIYCHNCGTRAGPTDVYCRQCGTKLRGR